MQGWFNTQDQSVLLRNLASLPNFIYRFSAIPESYFVNSNKLIPNTKKGKIEYRIAKKTVKEKNKIERLALSDLKIFYRLTAIKTMLYWQSNTQIDYQNRIASPEIYPNNCSQLIFDKKSKDNRAKIVFLTNDLGTTGHPMQKIMTNLASDLRTFTKISSKWISSKCKTQKLKPPRRKHRRKPK